MESNTVPVALAIMDSARPPARGEVRARSLSAAERTVRSLKRLGLAWVAALVCVFIPLLHFVLVPALFVLGPVLAVRAWGGSVVLEESALTCPKCGQAVKVEAGAVGWPVDLHCEKCGVSFDLRPAA